MQAATGDHRARHDEVRLVGLHELIIAVRVIVRWPVAVNAKSGSPVSHCSFPWAVRLLLAHQLDRCKLRLIVRLRNKEYSIMKMPIELKPALMGAAGGAIALAILGFTWGGWTTASSAAALAQKQASEAVIAALAPICVANFRLDKDSAAQLVELKKARSWEQASFVEKGGWTKMPGIKSADTAMSRTCAEMILAEKA
jgi:hypothetical protein